MPAGAIAFLASRWAVPSDDPDDQAVMLQVGEVEVLEDQMKSWLPEGGRGPTIWQPNILAATEAFDQTTMDPA